MPRDGKPVAKYAHPDEAYLEIAEAVRKLVASQSAGQHVPSSPTMSARPQTGLVQQAPARSSNMAIRKDFNDAEKHAFLEDGFEFIARFFEESVAELQRRNPGVECKFRRNGADVFSARAFVGGKQEAQCRVMLGGVFGRGISFSYDADAHTNSSNEQLSVRADDQGLMFDALMAGHSGRDAKGMSQHGAAEHLWEMFIKPMQARRR